MHLKTGILFTGLTGLALSLAYAKSPAVQQDMINGKKIELARYAKAYIGQGNVTVEVAPYKSEGSEGAILLFRGIESVWDDKAIVHSIRPNASGKSYFTRNDGKEWETLRITSYSSRTSADLYVPGGEGAIKLAPSDGAAQLTSPRAIYQTYLEQQATSTGSK